MTTPIAGFVVTQTNPSGFSSISPDPNEPLAEPNPLIHTINTVYESIPFSVDLTISGQFLELDVVVVRQPVQIMSPITQGLPTVRIQTLSTSTVRLSGYHSFPGAGFFFKMYGSSTLALLPSDTKVNYEALVQYNMPPTTSQQFTIVLPIKFDVNGTIETHNLTIYQWAVWNYTSAVAAVKRLVASRK